MNSSLKTIIAYAISVLLLTFYGGQVCPYIETLTIPVLLLIHTGAFVLGFFIRMALRYTFITGKPSISTLKYALLELSVCIIIGVLITICNYILYTFPPGSGLKIVLGCATTGFFISIYLSLDYERSVIDSMCSASFLPEIQQDDKKFFSISKKFISFLGISYFMLIFILLLLIYKDIMFLHEQLIAEEAPLFTAIAAEIIFVFAVVFGGSFIVGREYSKNLKLIFERQLQAFTRVNNGNYDTYIPAVSNDELGLIANHSNQMIRGLQEKEKIKTVFGKYMNPSIARNILSSDSGSSLGGRNTRVAVLFTDIRDYTTLSETIEPAQLVEIINEYFSIIVNIVFKYNGILDKFIGDAAMAVFGLDDHTNACDSAVNASIDIISEITAFSDGMRKKNLPAIKNGIGIHFGTVLAGNIGSSERMEYTVIGDTVNVASRLESVTKKIHSPCVISETVYKNIDSSLQARFSTMGMFNLKGKSQEISVYGLNTRSG
ncbi:MAG: adenylate/guanylate cyclase domain-containing protein [bacterium]|nr:adenylate/guanylate cyclase domain-containing protein [bacterium]